jgi:hypothetical protein
MDNPISRLEVVNAGDRPRVYAKDLFVAAIQAGLDEDSYFRWPRALIRKSIYFGGVGARSAGQFKNTRCPLAIGLTVAIGQSPSSSTLML